MTPSPRPGTRDSVGALLSAVPLKRRTDMAEAIGLSPRQTQLWRHRQIYDLRPYFCLIGYAACRLDRQLRESTTFDTIAERTVWSFIWDVDHHMSDAAELAKTLKLTSRTANSWRQLCNQSESDSLRAIWVRIGMTWVAGGSAPAGIVQPTRPASPSGRLESMSSRLAGCLQSSARVSAIMHTVTTSLVTAAAEYDTSIHSVQN